MISQPFAIRGTCANEIGTERQPGHWLLASLGKKVLLPGGLELTRWMLAALNIGENDDVVEFAPGLGVTAKITLAAPLRSYTAIERDQAAASGMAHWLTGANRRCVLGSAENTGLPSECATVVYGEAMLSMQTQQQKSRIVNEAARILCPDGRYGIHELCLTPDDIDPKIRQEIQRELSLAIHVGVQPVTSAEWRTLLELAGLHVRGEKRAPMHLLEPVRMIQDEGILGMMRIAFNVARKPVARKRVLRMRRLFREYGQYLEAISLIAVKPS